MLGFIIDGLFGWAVERLPRPLRDAIVVIMIIPIAALFAWFAIH